jgi:cytochrome c553
MIRTRFALPFALSAAVIILAAISCDSIFPSQTKYGVPSDHTRNMSGALHRSGWDDPMESCADCHGDSLQGGVQPVGNRRVVAPSCYQCHGAVWEGGNDGEEDQGERDD